MTAAPGLAGVVRERALAACPRCGTRLELTDIAGIEANRCAACDAMVLALVLPRAAAATPAAGAAPELAASGEARCFFHAEKAAHVPCHACGRFLCALCELDVEGKIWCPVCFEAARSGGALATLKNEETQHDAMALTIAAASWVVWPFSLLAAPVILYLTIRYWNAPRRALVPRSRWRFLLALVLICGPLALWAILLTPAIRHGMQL